MRPVSEILARFLDVGRPAQKSDCIFVLAGRQERKVYGVDLWRKGYARELILSVGRFEWRRFYDLGLRDDGGLRLLVESTPPVDRHFFVRLRETHSEAMLVKKGHYGTLTEAQALAQLLKDSPPRSLMVVSSPIHLGRVRLAMASSFRGSGIRILYVGSPGGAASVEMTDIFLEFRKYLFYLRLIWLRGPRRQADWTRMARQ